MNYLKTFEQAIQRMPAETEESSAPISSDALVASEWYPDESGWGDYTVSFKTSEGTDASVSFKDTGNRRFGGDKMYAAFVGLAPAEDGKEYVAEATMEPSGENSYEIVSFTVYEKQS